MKGVIISDIYSSEALGKDRYSITFSFRISNKEGTVEKEVLERILKEIERAMQKRFNAELRS